MGDNYIRVLFYSIHQSLGRRWAVGPWGKGPLHLQCQAQVLHESGKSDSNFKQLGAVSLSALLPLPQFKAV